MLPIDIIKKGKSTPRVVLVDMNAIDIKVDPADATAAISFTSAGLCDLTGSSASPADYNWKNTGVGADYDIRVDITSGSFTSGPAAATWHNLASTRTWTVTQTSPGDNIVDATVQIRDAVTLTVLAGPKAFDFRATVDI